MLSTLCWGEYKLIPSCCAQLDTGSDILEDKTNRMPEKIIYINDFLSLTVDSRRVYCNVFVVCKS